MTFLRTFEPSIYDLVEKRSEELLSTGGSLWPSDRKETHQERWERWQVECRLHGDQVQPYIVGETNNC